MSRVGKNPVIIPQGVTVEFDPATKLVSAKGKLGELSVRLNDLVTVKVQDSKVLVEVGKPESRFEKAIWGTSRALIQNLVTGVSEGYQNELELNGVGYRMELTDKLVLYIGFSHPVTVEIPEGITLKLEKNVLKGSSTDKQKLGNFFSNIHNLKPCDVYKHKGFKFPGRFYRKKVGKKGK